MQKSIALLFILFFILNGCKTTAEIRREQMVEGLSKQMIDNQKLSSEVTVKMQELEQRVSEARGIIEESGHNQQNKLEEKFKKMQEQIDLLILQNQQRDDDLKALKKTMSQQSKFVKEVLKRLKKLTGGTSRLTKMSSYKRANVYYSKRQYTKAKPIFKKLIKSKKYKKSTKARMVHNLGIIEYNLKNYENALVYLSKLYTEYSKSAFNKNGLYYMGLSFKALGKQDEARQSWEEVIKKFPKSKSAKKAKKQLKRLK